MDDGARILSEISLYFELRNFNNDLETAMKKRSLGITIRDVDKTTFVPKCMIEFAGETLLKELRGKEKEMSNIIILQSKKYLERLEDDHR
jgi:hypothetical protein